MGKQSKKRRAAAVEATADEVPLPRAEPAQPRSPLPPTSPGAIGAYLGVGLGFGFLALAIGMWGFGSKALPFPLILGMVVFGALQMVCAWLTLRRERVAWSFAVAMSGTIALACLFGAPKIRDAMEVGIGVAMLPSVLAAVTTIFLAMAADTISSRA